MDGCAISYLPMEGRGIVGSLQGSDAEPFGPDVEIALESFEDKLFLVFLALLLISARVFVVVEDVTVLEG